MGGLLAPDLVPVLTDARGTLKPRHVPCNPEMARSRNARLLTRIEFAHWGSLSLICRMQPNGMLAERYVSAAAGAMCAVPYVPHCRPPKCTRKGATVSSDHRAKRFSEGAAYAMTRS